MNKFIALSTERSHKIVLPDMHNSDEYLVGFISSSDINNVVLKANQYVKPVNLDCMPNVGFTDVSHYIRALIPDDEFERVMNTDAWAEISCDNLVCDAEAYYMLYRKIPKDYVVIDIGCAYNAQSFLFQEHKKYIGVNPESHNKDYTFGHFQAKGTEYYGITGQEFMEKILPTLDVNLEKTFAICTYVPDDQCQEMVRETFKNCYVFYPH